MLHDLKTAYIRMIINIRPTCVATFTEGPGLNAITAQERLRHILNVAQRTAYGRNWCKRPPHERIQAVGFREHHLTNPHWHLALHAPGGLLASLHEVKPTWSKIRFDGVAWVDILDNPQAYADYMTKNLYLPETRDDTFIYSAGT